MPPFGKKGMKKIQTPTNLDLRKVGYISPVILNYSRKIFNIFYQVYTVTKEQESEIISSYLVDNDSNDPPAKSRIMKFSSKSTGLCQINPHRLTTPMGRRLYMTHMLLLPFLPIIALITQNSITMKDLVEYQSEVQISFVQGKLNLIASTNLGTIAF